VLSLYTVYHYDSILGSSAQAETLISALHLPLNNVKVVQESLLDLTIFIKDNTMFNIKPLALNCFYNHISSHHFDYNYCHKFVFRRHRHWINFCCNYKGNTFNRMYRIVPLNLQPLFVSITKKIKDLNCCILSIELFYNFVFSHNIAITLQSSTVM